LCASPPLALLSFPTRRSSDLFGLSIIIQNGLLELFTADSRRLQAGAIEVTTVQLVEGVWVGALPALQFVTAVVVIAGLQLIFYRDRKSTRLNSSHVKISYAVF